jgi:hypothetical protein
MKWSSLNTKAAKSPASSSRNMPDNLSEKISRFEWELLLLRRFAGLCLRCSQS